MTVTARSPVRVRLSRAKGWRMPPNTVKVDRTTKWGNPYVAGRDGDRARCVALYRKLQKFGAEIEELRGKNLACWCPLDQPCHADLLLALANRRPSR
jgi:hypothetical protein